MPTYEVNLVPAYGRDYKTEEEVKRDWESGKDFLIRDIGQGIWDSKYTSIRDWKGYVRIRFNKLEDTVILKGEDQ